MKLGVIFHPKFPPEILADYARRAEAAGLAAMRIMESPGLFENWHVRVTSFLDSLQASLDEIGFPARIQSLGCSFYIYIGTREPVNEYKDFANLDPALAKAFYSKCVEKGVYFHTDFTVSERHDEATLGKAAEIILSAAREAKEELL